MYVGSTDTYVGPLGRKARIMPAKNAKSLYWPFVQAFFGILKVYGAI